MTANMPQKIRMPDGNVYVPVLLKIESRDEEGRPETLTFLPPDRPMEMMGGEQLMVVYVNRGLL